MLRREPVVHVKGDEITIQTVDEPFTEIVIKGKATKHPSTTVEVDIDRSFLLVGLRRRLKDADRDLRAPRDGTFLLCDAKDLWAGVSAVADGVLARVAAVLFDGHFVGVQSSSVEGVVVLDVGRVEPGKQ